MSKSVNDVPIFLQEPSDKEAHVNIYLEWLGQQLAYYRHSLDDSEFTGATNFCKNVLNQYFEKPVGRSRLVRAEKGDVSVAFGVYAAFFTEMKIWPEIMDAICYGQRPTARYMHLVQNELKLKNEARKKFDQQQLSESSRRNLERY